ncbi:MAG: cytochrome P450 [Proteobacteria bacterium]|nr:cytochrome P450 [Pseudomonadota bacterium]HQR04494.1 cytochrome P450 [Rhodocyclaceae bacterium]
MHPCPAHTLLDLDVFARGTPRDTIDRLREQHRILWEPDGFATGGHWLLFRQEDIDHVLKTPELFSSGFGPLLDDFPPELLVEQQKSMTFMDPPLHRKYRGLVDHAFRLKSLEAREGGMRRIATGIVDTVIDKGRCEFISEVATQLPMRVMYDLLGVEVADYRYVADLTNTLALADDPDFAENRAAGFHASLALIEFGTRLAADHRRNARDSLTMEVLGAEIDGERITDREFGCMFNNLIVGGMETTRNTLALGIHQFILQPDQYRLLEQDPELVPAAVEEILRYRNTVIYLRRTATKDLELAGEQIRKGDKLVCILGAPNRDPDFFEEPDRFDIRRPLQNTRKHYRTFGQGGHYCVGVHQARLNLKVMLEEIIRRMTNFRLLAEPRYARSIFMDGFKEMHVAFDKR